MMSEKRFICIDVGYGEDEYVEDNGKRLSYMEVVDVLNEQQATIIHLEKVNGKNFAKRRLLEQDNLILRNENEQLRKELDNFKPVMFQDVRKGTVILYSKGDIDE